MRNEVSLLYHGTQNNNSVWWPFHWLFGMHARGVENPFFVAYLSREFEKRFGVPFYVRNEVYGWRIALVVRGSRYVGSPSHMRAVLVRIFVVCQLPQ